MSKKEDAQLVCPIAYDDPSDLWPVLGEMLRVQLPLKGIHVKSPLTGHNVTIGTLPLRFMPSSASLFKDTNHPFRWFLAPYVHLYLLKVSDMSNYKASRADLKTWIEARQAAKQPWMVVHMCPRRSRSTDTNHREAAEHGRDNFDTETKEQARVYDKLANEFYGRAPGDRCVQVTYHIEVESASSSTDSETSSSEKEKENDTKRDSSTSDHSASSPPVVSSAHLIRKLADGVVSSFHSKSALYLEEISLLEATDAAGKSVQGGEGVDFRQLFLVKESLALMYQMLQLPYEALVRYDELQALIPQAQQHESPGGHALSWPLENIPPPQADELSAAARHDDDGKDRHNGDSRGHGDVQTEAPGSDSQPAVGTEKAGSLGYDSQKSFEAGIFWGPICAGRDLLSYSINQSRKRILKSRMGATELHKYIFARQAHFLGLMNQFGNLADRGLQYITSTSRTLLMRLEKEMISHRARLDSLDALKREASDGALNPEKRTEYVSIQSKLKFLEVKRAAVDSWAISSACCLYTHCRQQVVACTGLGPTWPLENVFSATTPFRFSSLVTGVEPDESSTVQKSNGKERDRDKASAAVDLQVCERMASLLYLCIERSETHENLLRKSRSALAQVVTKAPSTLLEEVSKGPVDSSLVDLLSLPAANAPAEVDNSEEEFSSVLHQYFCVMYPSTLPSNAEDVSKDFVESKLPSERQGKLQSLSCKLSLTLCLHLWQLKCQVSNRLAETAMLCSRLGDLVVYYFTDFESAKMEPSEQDLSRILGRKMGVFGWNLALRFYRMALNLHTPGCAWSSDVTTTTSQPSSIIRSDLDRWPSVFGALLQKLLHCSALSNDSTVYLQSAVMLQLPSLKFMRQQYETDDLLQVSLNAFHNKCQSDTSSDGTQVLRFPFQPYFSLRLGIPGGKTVDLAHRKESIVVPFVEVCCDGLSLTAGTQGDDRRAGPDASLPIRSLQVTISSHLRASVRANVCVNFRQVGSTSDTASADAVSGGNGDGTNAGPPEPHITVAAQAKDVTLNNGSNLVELRFPCPLGPRMFVPTRIELETKSATDTYREVDMARIGKLVFAVAEEEYAAPDMLSMPGAANTVAPYLGWKCGAFNVKAPPSPISLRIVPSRESIGDEDICINVPAGTTSIVQVQACISTCPGTHFRADDSPFRLSNLRFRAQVSGSRGSEDSEARERVKTRDSFAEEDMERLVDFSGMIDGNTPASTPASTPTNAATSDLGYLSFTKLSGISQTNKTDGSYTLSYSNEKAGKCYYSSHIDDTHANCLSINIPLVARIPKSSLNKGKWMKRKLSFRLTGSFSQNAGEGEHASEGDSGAAGTGTFSCTTSCPVYYGQPLVIVRSATVPISKSISKPRSSGASNGLSGDPAESSLLTAVLLNTSTEAVTLDTPENVTINPSQQWRLVTRIPKCAEMKNKSMEAVYKLAYNLAGHADVLTLMIPYATAPDTPAMGSVARQPIQPTGTLKLVKASLLNQNLDSIADKKSEGLCVTVGEALRVRYSFQSDRCSGDGEYVVRSVLSDAWTSLGSNTAKLHLSLSQQSEKLLSGYVEFSFVALQSGVQAFPSVVTSRVGGSAGAEGDTDVTHDILVRSDVPAAHSQAAGIAPQHPRDCVCCVHVRQLHTGFVTVTVD